MSVAKKFYQLVCLAAIAMSPFALSAADCCGDNINAKDVAGSYQISGFSNSLDGVGSLAQPQSQAVVGRITFNKDGITGVINFIDFTAIVGNDLVHIYQENLPFTWSLGGVNGSATATISDFPAPGVDPVFAISFKQHKGKVTGFSQLTIDNTVPTARWTLIQGERFN